MRQCWWVFVLGVALPLATSFITYTFVSMGINPLEVGDTGALIIILTLVKLMLLSTQGIIPVNMDEILADKFGREERSLSAARIPARMGNNSLYQVPEVHQMPCIRRFLCELENTARTSDNYLPKEPAEVNGRILEEEVAPEEVDPLTELQIEAVRALYREEDPTGELSARGKRAVEAVEGLTGAACETAYKLCPGRFTTPRLFWTVFEEMNILVHEHD